MEINRQNYERYFIDFLDGNLDREKVEILMSFLEFNPDLKEEFADIEKMCLIPGEEVFARKANLVKSESDLMEEAILKDFDMYCISSMENDIAEEEKATLQDILHNDPDREETFRLYLSTRLLPDANIAYPGKERLKKKHLGIPYRIVIPAAAAVAVLVILLHLVINRASVSYPVSDVPEETESMDSNENNFSPSSETATPTVATSVSPTIKKSPGSDPMIDASAPGEDEGEHQRETIRLSRIESKSMLQAGRINDDNAALPREILTVSRSGNGVEDGGSAETSGTHSRLSLWILADAGIRGLNSVSEDEYHLDKKTDENGKIRRFTFESPVFGISAPLRKPDKQR